VLTIDGAAGGGQLLRTALSLAAVTDTAFRIERIRGSRPTPGLRPQHLAAVELVADLCDADVEGAELDSRTVVFRPGDVRRRTATATVETAGSVTLLFDTVLPVAAVGDDPVRVRATGGTDVKWAPTVEYQRSVKLPLLATYGLDARLDLVATGFYPAGGGVATLQTVPSPPSPIRLEGRGRLERVDVYSKASASLTEREVADRQAARASERLADAGVDAEVARVGYVPTRSPGSSLLLRAVYDDAVAGFDALGERGRSSEAVADDAVAAFEEFHAGDAPVDAHMADQLLVFLALVGGRVRLPAVTDHVRTNLDVLAAFGSDATLDCGADGPVVTASPHPVLD
jgi:RNA 3'-terminal phosphate cyclase (ATP)